MALIGMIVTIAGIIGLYAKYGEQYNLKKGGVYSRLQSRMRIIDECNQCVERSY